MPDKNLPPTFPASRAPRALRLAGAAIMTVVLWLVPAAHAAPRPPADSTVVDIIAREDARDGEGLLKWTRDRNPLVRARAARALGRLQDARRLSRLQDLSQDPDPKVRLEALFALGQMWNAAGEKALLGVESGAGTRSLAEVSCILEGLGKCAAWDAPGAKRLVDALEDTRPAIRARAAASIGVLVFRIRRAKPSWLPASPPVDRLVTLLRDPSDDVVRGAAYALYRLAWAPTGFLGAPAASASWRDAARDGLLPAASHRSPEVRAFAASSLGFLCEAQATPGVVISACSDSDWRVRVMAAAALGRGQGEASEAALGRLLADRSPLVQVEALRALSQRAAKGQAAAVRALMNAKGTRVQVYQEALHALAAIEGAAALDEIRKATASTAPALRRASALGWRRLVDLPDKTVADPALASLVKLRKDSDRTVRLTALEMVSTVIGKPESARSLMLAALDDADPVARALAADALARDKVREAVPGLVRAVQALHPERDVEVLSSLLDALAEIGDARAEPVLSRFLSSPHAVLAECAAKGLSRMRKTKVVATPPPPRVRPLSKEARSFILAGMRAEREGHPVTVVLTTDRGAMTVRLEVTEAPLTCWNFVRLAREGYFRGLVFHRVVPNFVAQGGDPRGDGWGGPGYTIRCEYNPLRYERGAVGMALAGKDTGGSQFFLTHSPQFHLDGHYTIFANLLEGGDVLDTLSAGDAMRRIEVRMGPSR